jgi:hypothetical protein
MLTVMPAEPLGPAPDSCDSTASLACQLAGAAVEPATVDDKPNVAATQAPTVHATMAVRRRISLSNSLRFSKDR